VPASKWLPARVRRRLGWLAADPTPKPTVPPTPEQPPALAGADLNLALAQVEEASRLLGEGRGEESAERFQQILGRWPDLAEAHNGLGAVLGHLGQLDAAMASFERAIALKPDLAEAYYNLGTGQLLVDRRADALVSFQQAVAILPSYADAHFNLGYVLLEERQLSEAIAAYRQAIEHRPDRAETYNNLGTTLLLAGEIEESVAAFRRATEIRPSFQVAHANYVLTRHYEARCDRETLAAEARTWAARHAQPAAGLIRPHRNDRSPERKLRVGYVSADFRRHPIGYILEAFLPAHDPAQVETFCYSNNGRDDDVTAQLRAVAHQWRDVARLDDDALAELVRTDGIDILVDLAGHSDGHRLLAFARKPAPVQVTWLGNSATTGMDTIEYLLADRHACPPGDEGLFTEAVTRLPDAFLCYAPRGHAPPVAPLPARARGGFTYGCFNNLAKVTSEVVAAWSAILRAQPDSTMFMKTPALDDPGVRARYLGLFAANGVPADRVRLVGQTSQADVLGLYGEVDVALDPFPYNGCMTTIEALWMGVPVLTLAGDHFVSRVGVSLLSTLGLEELVAATPSEYFEKAVGLAGQLDRLAEIRLGLRDRMERSPLCDGPGFARGLEAAYRQMWRRWCAESPHPPTPSPGEGQ
jgi:protein O-GlcNAc transferase